MSHGFFPDRDTPPPQDPPPMRLPLPVARMTPSGVKLFTPSQVALATFLGSPLAGGVLLAMSHRRAKTGRAWQPLLVGVAVTAAIVTLGAMLPNRAAGGISIAGLIAMRQLAIAQRPGIEAAAGGRTQPASWWSAVGVSAGFLAAVVAAVFAVGIGWTIFDMAPSVSFGRDQDVQYADGATTADARLVGSFLMEKGFFSPQGKDKTVRVARTAGDVVVSFVLADDAWTKPGVQAAFGDVRAELAKRFPGVRVVVHLCDDTLENQYSIVD